jgi:predicted nucleic acid-binding protein
MQAGKRKIYWDTTIFLAWLQDEDWGPDVAEGIEETVRDVHNNRIVLFTSIMTRTEVLESRMSPNAQKMFRDLFNRRNVSMIDVNPRVSDVSHFIRDYYMQRGIKLSSPDSIHLATAIVYEADEFQTLDGGGKRKRPNDLIPLSGNVAGTYKLIIKMPSSSSAQGSLFTAARRAKQDDEESEDQRRKIALNDEEI